MPSIATNKKALHDYQMLEKIEAGIRLTGAEVKSVKGGSVNLKGSYVTIDNNSQAWLIGAHIAPYRAAGADQTGYDPTHSRRLLLHKKQIGYLIGKSHERGLTIMPISVYTKGSLIKLELAVARGKKQYDKRETIKKRETDRNIRRALRR